jgi:hypothetical protein
MAVLAAAAVPGPACAVDLVLEYVGTDGRFVRGPLGSTWNARFETRSPVRRVRTFKGQRNFDGLWWSATTGGHVGFESWLEREHLMLLDFDPDVIGVSSQPFWLHWTAADGVAHRHVPDFFARLTDGCGVVVDVRPDERVTAQAAEAFAVTARACEQVGWQYRRVGKADPVLAANVRWLAGYRHPRCFHQARGEALLRAFSTVRELSGGVSEVGDPIAVLPVAFHLLWTGALVTDLEGIVLGGRSLVRAAEGRAR